MRVLHVAECIGGVDRYLRMLLKYSNCENIVVLSQLYNRNDYEHLADSVEIMQIEHNINFNAIKEAYQLRKVIKKYKPDIVYAHSSIAGAITRMACLFLHTKVIYNPHGWSFNMDDRNNKIYIILEIKLIFPNIVLTKFKLNNPINPQLIAPITIKINTILSIIFIY